jgi:hypothetical protein
LNKNLKLCIKILVDVKRNSGSIIPSGKCFISSEPDTQTAVASSKKLPIYFRAYELECLSNDEITSVTESDDLKTLIENKGYTFTNILKPNGELLRGVSHTIKPGFLNQTSATQLLSTYYLEQIFGYWNVYEMDIQKYFKCDDIVEDGFTNIYGYTDYKILHLNI